MSMDGCRRIPVLQDLNAGAVLHDDVILTSAPTATGGVRLEAKEKPADAFSVAWGGEASRELLARGRHGAMWSGCGPHTGGAGIGPPGVAGAMTWAGAVGRAPGGTRARWGPTP